METGGEGGFQKFFPFFFFPTKTLIIFSDIKNFNHARWFVILLNMWKIIQPYHVRFDTRYCFSLKENKNLISSKNKT